MAYCFRPTSVVSLLAIVISFCGNSLQDLPSSRMRRLFFCVALTKLMHCLLRVKIVLKKTNVLSGPLSRDEALFLMGMTQRHDL